MPLIGTAISTANKIFQVSKKFNYFTGGGSVIDRYVPVGYKQTTRDVFKIVEYGTYGGLVSEAIQSLSSGEDNNLNGGQKLQPTNGVSKARPVVKTRRRSSVRYCVKYNTERSSNKYRRQSSFSKYR